MGMETNLSFFLGLSLENATYIYVNPPCRTSIPSLLREEEKKNSSQKTTKVISLKRLGNPKGEKGKKDLKGKKGGKAGGDWGRVYS
jgi:hypothetical protein